MILLKNGQVFAPDPLGMRDILVCGGQIVAVEKEIELPAWGSNQVFDLEGRWVIPGLIDSHIHIAGAGGEGGPASRTPPLRLDEIVAAGITSVVGCLGTDGITRDVASVLMQAKAYRQGGLSAWIYTGSYQIPPPTILGDVARDIAFIDEVIGVGEIALADHRSSLPSVETFAQLAQKAKVAGLLGAKAGIVNIHIGDGPNPFQLIQKAVARFGLYYSQFLPTHCNRSRATFEAAKQYAAEGWIDLTTSSYHTFSDEEVKASKALEELLEGGVQPSHITLSSDAGGSLPGFDDSGRMTKMGRGEPISLFHEVMDAMKTMGDRCNIALATATRNPAQILKLDRKGEIAPGKDADLLVVEHETRTIHRVMCRGRFLPPKVPPVPPSHGIASKAH